jgi:hypothetical protein
MRTEKDALIDRLLLLYAVERGNHFGHMDGPFKLMKIPLMAELDSAEESVSSFNYTFFRYQHGPITTEIYEDARVLRELGLLDLPEHGKGTIKLTEKGIHLLKSIEGLYAENEVVCKYVAESAKANAPLAFGVLKKRVYNRTVDTCGGKMKIGDLPFYCDVVSKLEGDNVLRFQLDDDWLDTLWGEFHYSDEEKAQMQRIRPMAAFAAD